MQFNDESKCCSTCFCWKKPTQFNFNNKLTGSRRAQCKACQEVKGKRYRAAKKLLTNNVSTGTTKTVTGKGSQKSE